MKTNLFKGVGVVLGAIIISALGLFASDGLQGIDRDLVALSGGAGMCSNGTVLMKGSFGPLCVDEYEASPSVKCPHENPGNIIETEENINSKDCYVITVSERIPWRFVSLPQAQRLCATTGKRLPSSDEWYDMALGTRSDECVVDENSPQQTGGNESCVSSVGVYDVIGNVWEWTNENVIGNSFQGRELPVTGYVDSVDAGGVAITSSEDVGELYGEDYFWSKEDGVFGMIRGGFFGSQEDAGLYAVNASVQTSFASQGIGFRCVKDL